jgi:hypothetical protein
MPGGRPHQQALDVGRVHDRVHQQTLGINREMPLLSLDLFPCVISMRINAAPAFFGTFDTLTVNDGDGRTG